MLYYIFPYILRYSVCHGDARNQLAHIQRRDDHTDQQSKKSGYEQSIQVLLVTLKRFQFHAHSFCESFPAYTVFIQKSRYIGVPYSLCDLF